MTRCLEGRFRQGVNLRVPRSVADLRCPWVTAGDRSFPPVLARKWHELIGHISGRWDVRLWMLVSDCLGRHSLIVTTCDICFNFGLGLGMATNRRPEGFERMNNTSDVRGHRRQNPHCVFE